MFRVPTTIIVGAGASMDFGLPSGPALWAEVKSLLSEVLATTMPIQQSERIFFISAAPRISLESPASQAMFMALKKRPIDARQPLSRMVDLLNDFDVHASVDDFLRDNPSVRTEIKVAIASVLFARMYDRNGNVWTRSRRLLDSHLELPNQNTSKSAANWCRLFVGTCRPFLRGAPTPTRLTIINFNYDRLLETILHHFWTRTEAEYPAFEKCFQFIYPYGAFSELPMDIANPAIWICEQADKIGLADGLDKAFAAKLKGRLDESQAIFSIGFSCAQANAELLGLNAHHGWKIFYQNFEGRDVRLDRVMTGIGVRPDRQDSGSMTTLLANGFFEQDAGPAPKDP